MVASTDIKFYVHTNNNAPQIQNAFGSMINVLDAALVNGIQVGTISSMTASGKIVTAVFGTAHNLMQYQVIKIAGANQAEYNVEARILTVPNATTITFELAVVPSTTIATGTINCSLPPLGWEKPFSSVNAGGGGKGAYRSKNTLLPSRPFLRVVDELDPAYNATYTKYAKVGIVEDMSGIDTMLGVQAPFDSSAPDKNWVGSGSGTGAYNGWARWYYAMGSAFTNSSYTDTTAPSAGNRAWILIGNGDGFYILPASITSNFATLCYGFGSFESLLNADNSNAFLSATLNYATVGATFGKSNFTPLISFGIASGTKMVLQRNYTQSANYTDAIAAGLMVKTGVLYVGVSNEVGAPTLTNTTPLSPTFIVEGTTNVLRGKLPLLHWIYQQMPFNNYGVFEKSGVAYIAVNTAPSTSIGQVVFKIGDL